MRTEHIEPRTRHQLEEKDGENSGLSGKEKLSAFHPLINRASKRTAITLLSVSGDT
jgi:hypothetical protein